MPEKNNNLEHQLTWGHFRDNLIDLLLYRVVRNFMLSLDLSDCYILVCCTCLPVLFNPIQFETPFVNSGQRCCLCSGQMAPSELAIYKGVQFSYGNYIFTFCGIFFFMFTHFLCSIYAF